MKKIIFLILLGFIIMLGGCIPFGIAINNSVNVNEVFNESITQNKNYLTSTLKVNSKYFIMPAIKLHITSNEIHRNTDSNNNEYDAKFQFPINLIITNNNNKILYEYEGNLKWNNGTRSYDLNEVNSRSGEVIVDIDLDKISISPPGEIKISVLLGEDSYYFAKIKSAKLIIYDNVHKHQSAILSGIAIVVLGIIIIIIGIVFLILQQSNFTSKSSATPSDTADTLVQNFNKNNSSVNTTAMLCHLSTFAGLIIPFGGVLGPLIMWQIKKDEDPFINKHGIAALNFHLSMLIYYFVSFILAFLIIGFLFIMILALMDLILTIIASIKANNGEEYQYPFTITFVN